MKLFLISQGDNRSYDSFDSAVIAAESEEEAKYVHPGTGKRIDDAVLPNPNWVHPQDVEVKYLGEAVSEIKKGIICASYNAS